MELWQGVLLTVFIIGILFTAYYQYMVDTASQEDLERWRVQRGKDEDDYIDNISG